MLAYYNHPHPDTSMQSLHYQHPPSSTAAQTLDHFDTAPVDLSAYFDAFNGLADSQMPSQLAPNRPHNPHIRVQQSTPPAASGNSRMIRSHNNLNNTALRRNDNVGLLSPVHFQQTHTHTNGGHKRASSASSVTSAAPTSPLDHTRSYSQVANSDPYSSPSASEYIDTTYSAPQSNFHKSLPTPIDTPISSTFYDPYPASHDVDMNQTTAMMRRALYDKAPVDDDAGSYQHSVAQSVSSMSHNSPKTPLNTFPDEFDDGSKGLQQTGETKFSDVNKWMDEYLRLDDAPDFNFQVPMSRSMSHINDDLLLDSPSPTSAPQPKQRPSMNKSAGLLDSHYRTVFNDRLQHAQQNHVIARSQSPSTSISGEQSPFRQGSPYAAPAQSYAPQRSPQSRMTASQLRQQQKAGEDVMEMAQHHQMPEEAPKTISPKDAVYDYQQTPEEAAMPLFPQEQQVQYNSQFSTPLTLQQSMTSQPEQSYGGIPATRRETSNFSTSNYGYLPSQPQGAQGYPYGTHLIRQESSMQSTSDRTPEFPAHLRSMESSASDTITTQSIEAPQRPVDTSSDAGTYSCTYHGCPQRFETPAKLQKHKREAHRQTTPSGMTSVAAHNSQAGPHKCMRINPTTNKPCNSEFSRPYDLTRHEDTIHNIRKQKVQCHLCQEEKTFSRNDALTRHMRVVHPEVDWPGKQRRKNARN